MKTLALLSLLFLPSAFASEVILSPGSSTLIRAGDTMRVVCGGEGHHGRRERCECVPDSCNMFGYNYRYILKLDGVPVYNTSCTATESQADNSCMEAKSSRAECR